MIYVYTSAALNYLPKVKLLTDSVKKFLPESKMVLALCDEVDSSVDFKHYGVDEVIPISEKLCDVPDYKAWTFTHPIVELSTAIKPFVLLELLARPDCEAVLYFDPDMVIFSPLDDLTGEFKNASILLTPHVTIPETNFQHIIDNELCALKYGIYNFGFYGIKNSPEGLRYAKWWRDRVALFCYDDIPNGIFTDQKWNDIVPALFNEVKILKSPRFNVASWNTTQRRITGDFEKGFTVNGEPLGFYHFTGFDCGDHRIMVEKNSSSPEDQLKLVEWYAHEIAEAGKDPLCQRPWAFRNFSDGTEITKPMRTYFRKDASMTVRYPNPADVSKEDNYLNWYRANINMVEHLNGSYEALQRELNMIYHSRSWRLCTFLKKIRNVFR